MKYFQHPDMTEYQKEILQPRFRKIFLPKLKETRKGECCLARVGRGFELMCDNAESSEAYFVCLGYKGSPS